MSKPQLIIWLSGLIAPVLMVLSANAEYENSNAATPLTRGYANRPASLWVSPSPSGLWYSIGRLGGALIAIGLGAWLGVAIIHHYCACSAIGNFDTLMARIARTHRTRVMWHAMRDIAVMGSPKFTAELVVVTGLAMRARMRTWRPLAILALVYIGTVSLEVGLKSTITRAPLPAAAGMLYAGAVSSFPSGHCARAAAIYGALAYLFGQMHSGWRAALWAGVVILALMVGVAVTYLGWHRATDAIGGWALGATWLAVVIREMAPRSGRDSRIGRSGRKTVFAP